MIKQKKAAQQNNNLTGLKVETTGLSLMSNVVTCDAGMSPLMERFTLNKARMNK